MCQEKKFKRFHIPKDDADLLAQCRVETMRASGKGGQHVNRTESAVRITHKPSGISIKSQKYRSQHRNKSYCLENLRRRIEKLNEPRKPRIKTTMPKAVKDNMKENKKRRSEIKKKRKPVDSLDEG